MDLSSPSLDIETHAVKPPMEVNFAMDSFFHVLDMEVSTVNGPRVENFFMDLSLSNDTLIKSIVEASVDMLDLFPIKLPPSVSWDASVTKR